MADNHKTDPSSSGGSFLGAGPKFNQAGNNMPLPGEKVADIKELPFGGPRVWLIVLVVLVLAGSLIFFYSGGIGGTSHVGGHGGVSVDSRPALDPDHNNQQPDSSDSSQ